MRLKKFFKKIYQHLPLKKQVFGLVRLFSVPEKIFRHLHFQGWFNIKVGTLSFQMFHYGYKLENELFWKGIEGWEKTTIKIWTALSRDANYVVDIGANTGIFSLISKTVNPVANVYAIEPVSRVADKLRRNIEANGFDIHVEQKGFSNFEGKATIYDLPTDHIYSVTVNQNLNPIGREVIPTEIGVTTLDSYRKQKNLPRIDLIKIDVETHESEVLEGGLETIRKWKPALLIEILNKEVAHRVSEILKEFDYVYLELDENSGPTIRTEIRPHEFFNYLICSKQQAEFILGIWNGEAKVS